MHKTLVLVLCCLSTLAFLAGGAWGAEYCVYPGGTGLNDLQDALDDAVVNATEDVIIKCVIGTYTGNFTYSSSSGYSITLEGGYAPATGCAARVANPILTTLDGNNSDSVLSLYDGSGGAFVVDSFTIRNGNSTGAGGTGGGIYVQSNSSGDAGNITLLNNIIKGNISALHGGGIEATSYSTSSGAGGTILLRHNNIQGNTANTYYGGGVYAASGSTGGAAGDVVLTNNTITGNTAGSTGGGVYADSSTTSGTLGTVTLTNNTITGNTAACDGGGAYLVFTSGGSGTIECYNNIIRGNTGPDGGDICLGGTYTAYGYCNDYHDLSGSWNGGFSDNIDKDPLFADPVNGDYHLLPTSPCIDKGLNGAPGILGTDCDGDSRIIDGDYDSTATADMGVDEFAAVYVILHKDGALWNSTTGWLTATSHYYPGTAYARALKLWGNGIYLILHKEGAYFLGLAGLGLWTTTTPPYYPGNAWAVDVLPGVILHQDGALWYAATGWVMTTPPYYPGTAYARDLEVRADASYVILHKDGAVYDSATGWIFTTPPYYAGTNYAVDMKIEDSGYVILHKDGALWSTSAGWTLTIPPYYAGTAYAKALELVVNGYVILHKDGAIYNSVTGWNTATPPYYPGTNYAVDLELR